LGLIFRELWVAANDDLPSQAHAELGTSLQGNEAMKATPLLIAWHDEKSPVYSAHFEPHGKGRLATAGGDNHVRVGFVYGGSSVIQDPY
jgi:hypothetical protein